MVVFRNTIALTCAVLIIVFPVAGRADLANQAELENTYRDMLRVHPPTIAELGVQPFPNSKLRIEASARAMARMRENTPNAAPRIYEVQYVIQGGNIEEVFNHFAQYTDPAKPPYNLTNANSRVIELARDNFPRQMIILYNYPAINSMWSRSNCQIRPSGFGSTPRPCVFVSITSRGPHTWEAEGRGLPRPITTSPPPAPSFK